MATVERLELLAPTLQNDATDYELKSSAAEQQLQRIERRLAKDLIYNDFYWNYMHANCPVVLTGVSKEWKCRNQWTIKTRSIHETDDNRRNAITSINFNYLRNKVGNCVVPVADCTTEYFNSHAKNDMRFHNFLDYWQAKINADKLLLPSNNENASVESNDNASINNSSNESTSNNLYLKDWHLKAQMLDYDFYRVPKHFASDWLNEHLIANACDDYRFVYMGPKDSWTPFHADVFGSYSWSTNIAGCKKWLLLPPGEELKLADRLGNLPFRIDEQLLHAKQARFYTLLQAEDEAIFVPSGWYHQVLNLTDTISINHNWFNACNVQRIWQNMATSMRKVIAEIEDCRQMDNFDGHCQIMLRASFGLNYLDFLDMLECIAKRRLSCCATYPASDNGNNDEADEVVLNMSSNSSACIFFDTYQPNHFHMLYDLQCIAAVVQQMLQDSIVCDNRAVLYRRCVLLKELIKQF